MFDRALIGLAAALALQAFLTWRTPSEVWRDDLAAELEMAKAALRTAQAAAPSTGSAPDELLAAAVAALRARVERVEQQLDSYSGALWFQKAVYNTSAFHAHVGWLRQWQADWRSALRPPQPGVGQGGAAAAVAPPVEPPLGAAAEEPPLPPAPGAGGTDSPGSAGASRGMGSANAQPRTGQPRPRRPAAREPPPPVPEEAADLEADLKALEAQGIEPLVQEALKMMKAEPQNTLVQERGCEMLRYLATDEESRTAIAALKGTQAVLKAMEANPAASDVQGYCCGTLAHLAASAAARKTALLSRRGVKLVLRAMAGHLGSSFVQYKGCAMLANFASMEAEQAAVGSLGGIKAALNAIATQAKAVDVVDHCFGTLYNLAANPSNVGNITSLGGIATIRKAMGKHPESQELQALGNRLLARLGQPDGH